jgi:ABC-type glycerol-3-phosphate transport system permease component
VLALAFVTSPDMQPVTRALDRFASESIVHWELTMAASAFAILPVAILFGFLQRRLVNSLAVGSVKG